MAAKRRARLTMRRPRKPAAPKATAVVEEHEDVDHSDGEEGGEEHVDGAQEAGEQPQVPSTAGEGAQDKPTEPAAAAEEAAGPADDESKIEGAEEEAAPAAAKKRGRGRPPGGAAAKGRAAAGKGKAKAAAQPQQAEEPAEGDAAEEQTEPAEIAEAPAPAAKRRRGRPPKAAAVVETETVEEAAPSPVPAPSPAPAPAPVQTIEDSPPIKRRRAGRPAAKLIASIEAGSPMDEGKMDDNAATESKVEQTTKDTPPKRRRSTTSTARSRARGRGRGKAEERRASESKRRRVASTTSASAEEEDEEEADAQPEEPQVEHEQDDDDESPQKEDAPSQPLPKGVKMPVGVLSDDSELAAPDDDEDDDMNGGVPLPGVKVAKPVVPVAAPSTTRGGRTSAPVSRSTPPIVSGPTLTKPALSGPTLSGPTLSGPTLSGPTLSGPTLSGPTLSGPALSGPSVTPRPGLVKPKPVASAARPASAAAASRPTPAAVIATKAPTVPPKPVSIKDVLFLKSDVPPPPLPPPPVSRPSLPHDASDIAELSKTDFDDAAVTPSPRKFMVNPRAGKRKSASPAPVLPWDAAFHEHAKGLLSDMRQFWKSQGVILHSTNLTAPGFSFSSVLPPVPEHVLRPPPIKVGVPAMGLQQVLGSTTDTSDVSVATFANWGVVPPCYAYLHPKAQEMRTEASLLLTDWRVEAKDYFRVKRGQWEAYATAPVWLALFEKYPPRHGMAIVVGADCNAFVAATCVHVGTTASDSVYQVEEKWTANVIFRRKLDFIPQRCTGAVLLREFWPDTLVWVHDRWYFPAEWQASVPIQGLTQELWEEVQRRQRPPVDTTSSTPTSPQAHVALPVVAATARHTYPQPQMKSELTATDSTARRSVKRTADVAALGSFSAPAAAPVDSAAGTEAEADAADGVVAGSPAAQASTAASPGRKGRAKLTADGETYFELTKSRRVTVRKFKGMTLVDIREYFPDKTNPQHLLPGSKGISLTLDQFTAFKSLIPEIEDAVQALVNK